MTAKQKNQTTLTKVTNLLERLSSSQYLTNQSIAEIETELICLTLQVPSSLTSEPLQKKKKQQTNIQTILNIFIDDNSMNETNFQHVFRYLIEDTEFVYNNKNEIIQWLTFLLDPLSNYMQQISRKKRLLIMELLLNVRIPAVDQQGVDTFADVLVQTKCRGDLEFCYSLLWNVNEILAKLNLPEINNFNLNAISILSMKVIKNYAKLKPHLIDESLRFVTKTLLPKSLSHPYSSISLTQQSSPSTTTQLKELFQMLHTRILSILSTDIHRLGNAYRFVGMMLQFGERLEMGLENEGLMRLVTLCESQLKMIFSPSFVKEQNQNSPVNQLETQIQKLQQHFAQKSHQIEDKSIQNDQIQRMKEERFPSTFKSSQTQDVQRQNLHNKIQLNLRIELLRGVSFFVTQFFLFFLEHSEGKLQVFKELKVSKTIETYVKVFEILSYCNDSQIFCNFVQVYCKKEKLKEKYGIEFINMTDQHITKQIIRNCPTLKFQTSTQKSFEKEQAQPDYLMTCLRTKIQSLIRQGHLQEILQLIKEKIEKQYDQAFNIRQFQSACNALTLIFSVASKAKHDTAMMEAEGSNPPVKMTLSKDDIIEWIKTLINLNQSCLPKFRKLIVSKTYQLLSEVFEILLPSNQYLQQVVQNELITNSFPERKQVLQRLIQFYQKQGDQVFQAGYRNKIQLSQFATQLNSLLSRNQPIEEQNVNNQNTELTSPKQKVPNKTLRIYKLLERIFGKMEARKLSFQDRKCLWGLAIRVYKIGEKNDAFSLETILKLFSRRPEVLFARERAAIELTDEKVRNQLCLKDKQMKEIEHHFKKYPVFYQQQLKKLRKSTQQLEKAQRL